MPYVAPWLKPAEPAEQYLRGLQIGGSIAEANARLRQEQEEAQMQAQARQQTLQRETAYEQARIATEHERINADVALRAANLQRLREQNGIKTAAAAAKISQQMAFTRAIQSGVPVMDAMTQFPGAYSPSEAINVGKASIDYVGTQLDLDKKRQDIAAKRLEMDEAGRPKVPTMDIPYIPENATPEQRLVPPMIKGIPVSSSLINTLMGTNAPPGTGTSYRGPGAVTGASVQPAGMEEPAAAPGAKKRFRFDPSTGSLIPQ